MTEPHHDPERPKSTKRRWAARLGAAVLLLLIAFGGGGAWLTTSDAGLSLLIRLARGPAEAALGGSLSLEAVSGSLWGRLAVGTLTVETDDGTRVTARDVEIAWTPSALPGGTLDIARLGAGRVTVDLPAVAGDAPDADSVPFDPGSLRLPGLPVRLIVRDLSFPEITVARAGGPVYRAEARGAVHVSETGEAAVDLSAIAAHDGRAADSLTVRAEVAAGPRPVLDLAIEGAVPPDGLLWDLLGLDPALRRQTRLTLAGRGPLSNWRGELSLAAEGLGTLDGAMTLAVDADRRAVGFDGTLALSDAAAFGLPVALEGPTALDLALSQPEAEAPVTLDRLAATHDGLGEVRGSGTLDPSTGRVALDLTAVARPGASALVAPDLTVAGGRATVSLDGTLESPALTMDGTLDRAAWAGIGGGDLSLRAEVAPTDDGGGYRLAVAAESRDAAWRDATLDSLLGPSASARIDGTLAPDFRTLSDLTATLEPLGLSVSGNVGLSGDGVTAPALTVVMRDIGRLAPVVGVPLGGALRAELTDVRAAADGALSAGFDATLEGPMLVDPALSEQLGKSVTAAGAVRLASAGNVTLDLARLAAEPGEAGGTIRLATDGRALSGTLALTLATKALPPVEGFAIAAEQLEAEATLSGSVDAPALSIETKPVALDTTGLSFGAARARADLDWDGAVPVIDARLDAVANGAGPVTARAVLRMEPARLAARDIAVDALGAALRGELILDGYALPAQGTLTLEATEAGPALAFAGLPGLSAPVAATLTLSPGGSNAAAQAVSLDLRAETLSAGADSPLPGSRIERLRLQAEIADAFGPSGIDARLSLGAGTAAGLQLEEARATVAGDPSDADFELSLRGVAGKPLTLSAAGGLHRDGQTTAIALSDLDGRYGTIPIRLREPGRLALGADGLDAVALALDIADGRAAVTYRRGEDDASVDLDIAELPLAPLAALRGVEGVSGRLSARFAAREGTAGVRGEGTANLHALRIEGAADDAESAVALKATLDGGRLSLRGDAEGPGFERARVEAVLPVALSIENPGLEIAPDAALSGTVDLRVDLAALWPYLPLPEHQMAGKAVVDADLSGTVAEPSVRGTARLDAGRYEHLTYGTLLRDLSARLRFEDRRVVLESLNARDAEGGTLTAEGAGTLVAAGPDGTATLSAKNLQIIYNDAMKLWADIDLKARAGDAGSEIAGDVTVRRAEVDLSVALPPSIPSLDVETEEGVPSRASESDATEGGAVALDIAVAVPGQVFVRGRGVDSEWQGDLQITGTLSNPRVAGLLRAKRGRFDVVGKSFALKDSTIRFLGGETIDPELGIRGEYQAEDLMVVARLAGPASRPEIELTSLPPLPRDEILSRVLFGKTSGRLSPVEAAQLAASAAELSGGGTGFDLLGTIRRVVGVDVLQVDAGEEGANVRAGKYIADGVYVGAKQGAAPGSSGVEVEVEVTPNISVNTETGQSDSNVGVQFKWDY